MLSQFSLRALRSRGATPNRSVRGRVRREASPVPAPAAGSPLEPQRLVLEEPRQPFSGGGIESAQTQVLADALLVLRDRLLPAGVGVDRLGVGAQLQGREPQDLPVDPRRTPGPRLAARLGAHNLTGEYRWPGARRRTPALQMCPAPRDRETKRNPLAASTILPCMKHDPGCHSSRRAAGGRRPWCSCTASPPPPSRRTSSSLRERFGSRSRRESGSRRSWCSSSAP